MYLAVTPGGCTWYAPAEHLGCTWSVPGDAPGITFAKVQNLFECDLLPNYLQRFCYGDPIYYFSFTF